MSALACHGSTHRCACPVLFLQQPAIHGLEPLVPCLLLHVDHVFLKKIPEMALLDMSAGKGEAPLS